MDSVTDRWAARPGQLAPLPERVSDPAAPQPDVANDPATGIGTDPRRSGTHRLVPVAEHTSEANSEPLAPTNSYLLITRVRGKSASRRQRRCRTADALERAVERARKRGATVFWTYGPAPDQTAMRPLIAHWTEPPTGSPEASSPDRDG